MQLKNSQDAIKQAGFKPSTENNWETEFRNRFGAVLRTQSQEFHALAFIRAELAKKDEEIKQLRDIIKNVNG